MSMYQQAESLGSILHSNNLWLTTAESCTGGWVAQEVTAVPGSSNWFLQGWVTYSNESKTKQLGVPAELITKYGAVSEQVVTVMAQGAVQNSGANLGLATSGVAGPDGGTEVNPVGTVWIGIYFKYNENSKLLTQCLHLNGDRKTIREQTVSIILSKAKNLLTEII